MVASKGPLHEEGPPRSSPSPPCLPPPLLHSVLLPEELGVGKAQRTEMAEAVAYEEQRRRQVEANKRKLEELQLHHLSAAVREAAAKPSPAWKRKARPPRDAGVEPLRRSGRVANLPEKPDYRSGRKDLPDRGSATDEERRHAITKAQELAEMLDSRFPIFVKSITKYYASGGFALALPTAFCQEHLPTRESLWRMRVTSTARPTSPGPCASVQNGEGLPISTSWSMAIAWSSS